MSKDNKKSTVSFDDLMDKGELVSYRTTSKGKRPFFNPTRSRKGAATAALGFVGVATICALAVGSLVYPVGRVSAAGISNAIDFWNELPKDLPQDDIPLPQRTVLLDKNGSEFAQFYSENRQNVPLKSVAPIFIDALIATEDSRFYENNGFDTISIVRSALSTSSGNQKQGASGITQQLVKNLQILNSTTKDQQAAAMDRSFQTKLQELKYAIGLEEKYSKDEILEKYINTVYFGNGAYGISAAAKTYFNTTADKLTLNQASALVGVINNPTIYDPVTAPEGAKARQNMVAGRLLATGKIDEATAKALEAEPITLARGSEENGCGQSKYPFYCQLVREEILENSAYGKTPEERTAFLNRGGLTITTALDPNAMAAANEEALRAYATDNRVGTGIAVVVPGTGHIAAVGSNRDWGQGENQTEMIFAKAKRQVGSSFKPFTLATALEQGIPATTKMVSNSPYVPPAGFDAPPGGFSNYGMYNYGSVDAYQATKLSMNVWYVKLMERTGVLPVADMAKRLGVDSLPREGANAIGPQALSLTLGAYEISPLEMANAYSTFASGGVECNTVSILSAVRTDSGEKVSVSDPDCHQAIMPNVANTVNSVLQEPLKEDGTIPKAKLANGRIAAAKTGTTNDWADAWVVGYTPQFASAVWVGDPRGGTAYPLTQYVQYGRYLSGGVVGDGSVAAGPVWKSVMDRLHAGLPAQNFAPVSSGVDSAITARAVPDVRGLDVNTAISTLMSNGYKPVINHDTSGDANLLQKNVVVSQNPVGGTNGSHNQEVTITLSPGSDVSIQIPSKK